MTLAADSLDMMKLLVQVAQARHRALGDEEYPRLRVSLLEQHLCMYETPNVTKAQNRRIVSVRKYNEQRMC